MQNPSWLPIHAVPTKMGRAMDLGGADCSNVGIMFGPTLGGEADFREKADFIVQATNSYADLIDTLQRLSALSPVAANARTALDLHKTVKVIADCAIERASVLSKAEIR